MPESLFMLRLLLKGRTKVILTVLPGMLLGALSAGLALLWGSSLLVTLLAYSLVASTFTIAIGVAIFFPPGPLDLSRVVVRGSPR